MSTNTYTQDQQSIEYKSPFPERPRCSMHSSRDSVPAAIWYIGQTDGGRVRWAICSPDGAFLHGQSIPVTYEKVEDAQKALAQIAGDQPEESAEELQETESVEEALDQPASEQEPEGGEG